MSALRIPQLPEDVEVLVGDEQRGIVNFLYHMVAKVTIGEAVQFHDYMEKVFGSKVKVKILRAFHRVPNKDFTSRELAKFIGASHPGVLKALKDLEETNLVTVGTHGRANVVRLNRESLLSEKILGIFDLEAKTRGRLVEELRSSTSGVPAVSIALFGSIVKREESPRSDIDLLILTEDKAKAEETVSALQKRFSEQFGNSISPYLLSPNGFAKKRGTRFIKDVLEHHILIRGQKLEAVDAHPKHG